MGRGGGVGEVGDGGGGGDLRRGYRKCGFWGGTGRGEGVGGGSHKLF